MDDKCSKTFHVIIIDKIDILTSREEEEEEFPRRMKNHIAYRLESWKIISIKGEKLAKRPVSLGKQCSRHVVIGHGK